MTKKKCAGPNLSSTYNTHVHTFTLCCLLSRLKRRLNYHSFALHRQIQQNIMMFTLKGNASPDTTIWYQSGRGIWEVSWSGIHTHWSPCGRQTQQIAFARKLWLASLLEQKKTENGPEPKIYRRINKNNEQLLVIKDMQIRKRWNATFFYQIIKVCEHNGCNGRNSIIHLLCEV